MHLKEIITEHVLNLRKPVEKQKYADEVWNILQSAYSKVGGILMASSPQELVNKSSLWKMITRNGKISAVKIYKDQFGRKSIALGSDGTPQGKLDVRKLIQDDITLKRSWAEVSGAPEHLMLKYGAIPIPARMAEFLTKKSILSFSPDGYHYTRLIRGVPREKIIYGTVNLSNADKNTLRQNGIDLKEYLE